MLWLYKPYKTNSIQHMFHLIVSMQSFHYNKCYSGQLQSFGLEKKEKKQEEEKDETQDLPPLPPGPPPSNPISQPSPPGMASFYQQNNLGK